MLGGVIPGLCGTLFLWKPLQNGEAHTFLQQFTEHDHFLLAKESSVQRSDWNRKTCNYSVFFFSCRPSQARSGSCL